MGSWGLWDGEAEFTSWLSAEMPRHSYTALAVGSALAALILFSFGLFGGEEGGGWEE